MISFDLKCGNEHVFEIWFRSSADYEAQAGANQIHCPTCGDAQVRKAVMAPAVTAKSNRRSGAAAHAHPPAMRPPKQAEQVQQFIQALAQAQAEALTDSQWVGDKFADRARAMHYGEADAGMIHGTASVKEAKDMMEEGLPVAPLIVPIVPPEQLN